VLENEKYESWERGIEIDVPSFGLKGALERNLGRSHLLEIKAAEA
jgi:hypothetical protein